jgi:hypothetical protein
MGNLLRCPNGKSCILIPRSGSHSIAVAALKKFWPDIQTDDDNHPAALLPNNENWDGTEAGVAMVVRNPVERFRSMCAHRSHRTVEEHLQQPPYGPLPQGDFKCFCFENQLNEAAEWLGLPTPLPWKDATDPALKPNLTPGQQARVREIYAYDIALWKNLQ